MKKQRHRLKKSNASKNETKEMPRASQQEPKNQNLATTKPLQDKLQVQSLPPSSQPLRQIIRHWSWPIRVIVFAIWTVLIVVLDQTANISGIWGPFWPVDPTVLADVPSDGSPFSVPFLVKNASALFDIKDATISCDFERLNTDLNQGLINVSTTTGTKNTISALSSQPYKCPFPISFSGKVVSVRMSIRFKYSYSLFGIHMAESKDGPFSWDISTVPPRWLKGEILR